MTAAGARRLAEGTRAERAISGNGGGGRGGLFIEQSSAAGTGPPPRPAGLACRGEGQTLGLGFPWNMARSGVERPFLTVRAAPGSRGQSPSNAGRASRGREGGSRSCFKPPAVTARGRGAAKLGGPGPASSRSPPGGARAISASSS